MKAHSITINLPTYVQGNGRDIEHYQELCELLSPNQSQLATFFLGRANSADHGMIYSPTQVGRVLDEDDVNDVQYALFGLLEAFAAKRRTSKKSAMLFQDFIDEFGELFTDSWSPTAIQSLDPHDVFQLWEAQRCKENLKKNMPTAKGSKSNKKM